jgi:acetylornithine deacetylase/succinyl-diaminopimelate desuccinylase-like protein
VALEAVSRATGAPARSRALAYLTDAFVATPDAPAVIVGPGSELQAHTVDECVPVEALAQAAEVYEHIALATMYTPVSAHFPRRGAPSTMGCAPWLTHSDP